MAVFLELIFPAPDHAGVDAELAGDGAAVAGLVGQTDGLSFELRGVGFTCCHDCTSRVVDPQDSAFLVVHFNRGSPS